MIEGLRQNGVEVVECHETLWHGIDDRVSITTGGWLNPSFWWRLLRTYFNLLKKFSQIDSFDLMVVGYPGQFDVFIAYLLCRLRKKKLVWDIFMSIYLIALERGLNTRSPLTVRIIKEIESLACRLPHLLILDTEAYLDWFQRTHGVSPNRFGLIPTGADDRIFKPTIDSSRNDGIFHVLYYGSFIPNHGVPYIIEAASQLTCHPNITFEMIGEGPELDLARSLVDQNQLKNVCFYPWMEQAQLLEYIHNADVCLGAFGQTPQSLMTVQNKIYECLAMAKPVITGDSIAVRQGLSHGTHIWCCDRNDPGDLARSIIKFNNDRTLGQTLAKNGFAIFTDQFTIHKLGMKYRNYLYKVYNS